MIRFKRVGGLRFWRLGRLGGSFYLTARRYAVRFQSPIIFDDVC